MNLKHLTDSQLIFDLQTLVKNERELLLQILYHLKEVETRKLYSDYSCTSLFDYACKELKYTADQAYRRIQAMRLLKEIPEAAGKINFGELSLTNINQAQRYFNENKVIKKEEKIVVLKKLINKSTRDGHKELLKLSQVKPLPQEIKKQVTPTHTYVSFNMSEQLEAKINEFKALLGPKSFNLNTSELVEMMVDLSINKLKENKFGKKRVQNPNSTLSAQSTDALKSKDDIFKSKFKPETENAIKTVNKLKTENGPSIKSKNQTYKNPRYISAKHKHHIWQKDHGKCTNCDSEHNLQFDHIKPLALGGATDIKNLRLLCFHCNQRQRIKAGLLG